MKWIQLDDEFQEILFRQAGKGKGPFFLLPFWFIAGHPGCLAGNKQVSKPPEFLLLNKFEAPGFTCHRPGIRRLQDDSESSALTDVCIK
jgi:hypothetical protein